MLQCITVSSLNLWNWHAQSDSGIVWENSGTLISPEAAVPELVEFGPGFFVGKLVGKLKHLFATGADAPLPGGVCKNSLQWPAKDVSFFPAQERKKNLQINIAQMLRTEDPAVSLGCATGSP